MDILVCVKRVPASMEDIKLTEDGEISESYLNFTLNEYDAYALEEAVQIKGELGGTVYVVTIGSEEAEEIIKLSIAKGADKGIRVYDESLEDRDTHVKARILSKVAQKLESDLIFTGMTSEDENHGQLGVEMGAILDLPYASYVNKIEFSKDKDNIVVNRELEGGLEEKLEMQIPAVFTIQTGINEPRYASIMARRKVDEESISLWKLDDLGLKDKEVGSTGSMTRVEDLYEPSVGKTAEIFEGSSEETSRQLAETLKKEGLVG